MTHNDIIRMAREAGFDVNFDIKAVSVEGVHINKELERFAALVAAAEREDIKAELEELREANEAFGKRQEWWTERMVDLEAQLKEAVKAEREECASFLENNVDLVGCPTGNAMAYGRVLLVCAAAIRERGDQ